MMLRSSCKRHALFPGAMADRQLASVAVSFCARGGCMALIAVRVP